MEFESQEGTNVSDTMQRKENMKTLQEYLNENYSKAHNLFTLSTYGPNDKYIHIYIHPQGVDGETIDFTLIGNHLISQYTEEDAKRLGGLLMKVNEEGFDSS